MLVALQRQLLFKAYGKVGGHRIKKGKYTDGLIVHAQQQSKKG